MDELNNNKENEIKTNEIIDAPKEVQKKDDNSEDLIKSLMSLIIYFLRKQ